jgi:hypothetical protein
MSQTPCTHWMTQGRAGESGSWCCACGVQVYAVDDRECRGCDHARQLFDGWVCRHHLMRITADLHVTYKLADGSCWTEPAAPAQTSAAPETCANSCASSVRIERQ